VFLLHPVEYKLFYRYFYTGFRRLLVVRIEMFLRRILQSWLYAPRLFVTLTLAHVAAELLEPGSTQLQFVAARLTSERPGSQPLLPFKNLVS
jgi:hypothetical protein